MNEIEERTSNGQCRDCATNVLQGNEYAYMLKDELWAALQLEYLDGFLCVGCLEARIGRRLVREDFNLDVLLTQLHHAQSDRLKERLNAQ